MMIEKLEDIYKGMHPLMDAGACTYSAVNIMVGKINEIIDAVNNKSSLCTEEGLPKEIEIGNYYSSTSAHRVYIYDKTWMEKQEPFPDGFYYDGIILGQKGWAAKGLWDKDGYPMLLVHRRGGAEERPGVYLDITSMGS